MIIDHHRQYISSIFASSQATTLSLVPTISAKATGKTNCLSNDKTRLKIEKLTVNPKSDKGWLGWMGGGLTLVDPSIFQINFAQSQVPILIRVVIIFVFVVDFLQTLILIVVPTYIMADWFFDRVALVINIGGVSNS